MKPRKAFRYSGLLAGILALAILSCSGAAEINNLFATDTPTPTNTFTPSPTLTPSPTPTPTQTSSPTPTPLPSGVKIEEQPDGTILFADYDNRYQLLLPANWEVVFSSQKELQQAVQGIGSEDPKLAEMAENFRNANPDVFRLAAMNTERKHLQASAPTLLTINTINDSLTSRMPMAFVTAMIEDNVLQGATSTTWDVIDNENGVEVGLVEGTRTFDGPSGMSVKARELVIAFSANDKLILVEVVAPEEYQEEIFASFKDRIDQIQVQSE